ncbi:MAG TPA: asparagine synthase (glutamine-hydrolyzing), partial [Thiolinea sp.]|nr:asparagine synthase (glutamine-hydrolyzing) [Thiolinea sp.]
MCGLTGFYYPTRKALLAPMQADLNAMTASLQHRGPDAAGTWLDQEGGIALGHRRLAVQDLSPQGSQPMVSATGRRVLVFNGEIYNHHKIRQRLEQAGVSGWRGHSDTETLLAAIEAWGLEQALTACEGMFALALWDRHARCLSLARDRMGEKPLYYGWSGPALLFGSELKALCRHRHWQGEINRVALAAQMSFSYIPEPLCIYQGTHKLEQGCLLQVPAGTAPGSRLESRRWWSLSGQIQSRTAARQAAVADPVAVVNAMESLLGEVVGAQMLADVPLGAFLSGGVDSSLIVALMQQQSGTPIRTFTIGFDEQDFDEAPFARAVAQHLGTRHTELTARPSDALEIIPQLPQLFDEPFSDMSQLPTFLVARLARSQVTVSLSGDGADELFGGYNRYFYAHSLWARMNAVPAPLRRSMAGLIRCARPGQWDRVFGMLKPVTPFRLRFNEPGQKMYK